MSRVPEPFAGEDESLDLIQVLGIVWRNKWLVVLSAIVCGGTAVVLALTAEPVYRAETVLTEVRDPNMSNTASLASQLGGLASLAGVNLGQSSGSGDAQAVLESRRLVEEFIKRNNLVPQLFPKAQKAPSLWFAVKKFKEGILTIRKDVRKGIIVVDVDWTDPAVAARWANGFVALANETLRARALQESNRNITYLNQQVERTNVLDLRRVMYNIIESETKTLMLANGRLEYAFEVVDPAVAPEIRIRPQRTLMVFVGVVLGVFIGFVAALIRNWAQRSSRAAGTRAQTLERVPA